MPDDHPLDDIDAQDPNTFTKEQTIQFGTRGADVWEREETETDLESMTESVEITSISFCNCGISNRINENQQPYRCCSCERIACSECVIEIRRYHYCPDCVQQAYGIDRTTYKALYLLEENVRTVDDLLETDVAEDQVITVRIDDAADTLLDRGYIRTDHDDEDDHRRSEAATVDNDRALSAEGREALHIGDELFGNDPDVQELKDEVEYLQAANGIPDQ